MKRTTRREGSPSNQADHPSEPTRLLYVLSMVLMFPPPLLAQINEPIDPFLATPAAGHQIEMPVVVISYLPTSDGIRLDPNITGSSEGLDSVRKRISDMNIQAKFMLEEGSRFRGYKDGNAKPFLGYRILRIITVYEAMPLSSFQVPWNPGVYRPDYKTILQRWGASNDVNNQGVKEFWIWGYHHGNLEPAESNMASPVTGDISNSERRNDDLPIYNSTYVVYNYNYTRTANEAVHNHGHQIEAMLSYVNAYRDLPISGTDLFWKKFVGQNAAGAFITGRCGWTHMPPNTTKGYDYWNTTPAESDIEDWTPAGTGQKKAVSANTWGQIGYTWPYNRPPDDKTQAQWYIYWMQSIPGREDAIRYPQADDPNFGLAYVTNWWGFVGGWDFLYWAGPGLVRHTKMVYALSPAPNPIDRPPVAHLSAKPLAGEVPLLVVFDGSASSDAEGNIAFFAWELGDGESGQGPLITHAYTTPGTYTVSLIVWDFSGASGVSTVQIIALPEGRRSPVAEDDAYRMEDSDLLQVTSPGILENDRDPEGGPLSALLVRPARGGSLRLHADGSFTYRRHPDFEGIDRFTYRASNGERESEEASVAILPLASCQDLYGVDLDRDELVQVDLETGSTVAVGLLRIDVDMAAVDFDGEGNLWLFAPNPAQPHEALLYTVDLMSGAARLIQMFDVSVWSIGDIAFGPDGKTLYWISGSILSVLDADRGEAVFIAELPFGGSTLTLPGRARNFVAVDAAGGRLMWVKPLDGTAEEMGPLEVEEVSSLAGAPDGTLYGLAGGKLYRLDFIGGEATEPVEIDRSLAALAFRRPFKTEFCADSHYDPKTGLSRYVRMRNEETQHVKQCEQHDTWERAGNPQSPKGLPPPEKCGACGDPGFYRLRKGARLLLQTPELPESGFYRLRIQARSSSGHPAGLGIQIGDQKFEVPLRAQAFSWSEPLRVSLVQGVNAIQIRWAGKGSMDIEGISLERDCPDPRPGQKAGCYPRE